MYIILILNLIDTVNPDGTCALGSQKFKGPAKRKILFYIFTFLSFSLIQVYKFYFKTYTTKM